MKLVALVPVHTSFPVAALSIGSFLREHREHEIEVHVGVHSNYADYTNDLSLFDELKGIATIHKVDEIDWMGEYNTCFYRYSVMHAKNLENLIKKVTRTDFDYVVVLDHDLHVKTDFVTKCLQRYPGADLIGTLQDNKDAIWSFVTMQGQQVNCMPKISAWHLLMSRRLFKLVVENTERIYPKLIEGDARSLFTKGLEGLPDAPLFVDTFAEILHRCRSKFFGEMHVGILKTEEFDGWVRHFYNSSFNYGQRTRGDYPAHIAEIEKMYRAKFPEGLQEFRKPSLTVRKIHEKLLSALILVAEQHATLSFNDTPQQTPDVRGRELERIETVLMTAKAMCVTAGIDEEMVRMFSELIYDKGKRAWESSTLSRGK